jgi:broad specificity phosphatase PhoE
MLRLLIIRHGQTSWNLEGRNQGHADIELDETGIQQATEFANALREENVDTIYSSDMKRTIATAEVLSKSIKVPVLQDKRLRERDYGEWEGKTHEEIELQDPEKLKAYGSDPTLNAAGGAETGIDVFARVGYFLVDLLREKQDGTVAIVTHGGAGSALLAALIHGSPATASCFRLTNAGITEITIDKRGRRRLVRYNDPSHLNCAIGLPNAASK